MTAPPLSATLVVAPFAVIPTELSVSTLSEGFDCAPFSVTVALAEMVALIPIPIGTVTGDDETVTLTDLEPEVTVTVVFTTPDDLLFVVVAKALSPVPLDA
jgi:hypothetical protein